MPRSSRTAFTLIELLVVIAIIAILAVVVILVLNPAQLLKESRDANRLSDAATIKSAIGLYSEDVGGSLGSSSIVYISIPDPSATSSLGDQCQGLNLPVPASDTYQCASSSTYRSTNGTGWIPVNLKTISFGSPISSWPIDPVNTTSSGEFYTYETNGTLYETTMALESTKYATTEASDGGAYTDLYEQGTSFTLAPIDFYASTTNPIYVAYVTTGTTWSATTNGSPITVEAIGGGASGDDYGWGSGGGGGGEFCESTVSYTSGASIPIHIGQGGASSTGGAGTATTWNTSVIVANGGSYSPGSVSAGGTGGTGSTCYNGGAGGTFGGGDHGGAGGGGAGGLLGVGGAGGSINYAGGAGGGGNGGGYAGAGNSGLDGGAGGNNHANAGGGAGDSTGSGAGSGTAGGGGGGGYGSMSAGGNGGAGTEWSTSPTYGSGGGGGGGGQSESGGNGGLYGGGGGGPGDYGSPTLGAGAQGILVITYTP